MANEGDDRDDFLTPDETIRVGSSSYILDDTVFPDATNLKTNAELGRLTVSNAPGLRGDTDGDGDIDQILAYGGRSFSILDANGMLVFDSADLIERVAASMPATIAPFDDTRSDNKGPEPEGIVVTQIADRVYAFVGLERGAGGVMMFDISDPTAVTFTGYVSNAPTDIGPEGLAIIPAGESPNGKMLLVVSNEVSGTVSIYEIVNLQGSDNDDVLSGTDRGETIEGNGGDDRIEGAGGADMLTGGTGKDTFVYKSVADTGATALTRDVVTDFERRLDTIDLMAIDANAATSGDEAFRFIGQAAFSKNVQKTGQLRYEVSDGNTIIQGDVNGDGVADFEIELTGILRLSASDFIL